MSVRVIEETMHDGSKRYRAEHAAGRRFFFFTSWRPVYSAAYGHYMPSPKVAEEVAIYVFGRWQREAIKRSRVLS